MSQLTIGRYLNQARIERNISLKQASDQTKIHERLLRDFEADKFDKLPNVTYLKGFLKQLAVVLHFNYEEAVELLEKTLDEKVQSGSSKGQKVQVALSGFAQNLASLKSLLKYIFSFRVLVSLIFTLIFASSLYYIGFHFTKKEPFHPAVYKKPETPIKESLPQPRKVVQLKIKEGECWIAYKIDSQPVRNLTLSRDGKLKLEGDIIRLSLGRPEAVEVRYQNFEVDLKPYITSGGTAHLIFPADLRGKYTPPFFVFNDDGTISTRKKNL